GSKLKPSKPSRPRTPLSTARAARARSLNYAKADGPDGCRDRPWRLRLDRGAEEPEPRYRLIQAHIVPTRTVPSALTKISEQRPSTHFGRLPEIQLMLPGRKQRIEVPSEPLIGHTIVLPARLGSVITAPS